MYLCKVEFIVSVYRVLIGCNNKGNLIMYIIIKNLKVWNLFDMVDDLMWVCFYWMWIVLLIDFKLEGGGSVIWDVKIIVII